jgi:hypothetical protein
MMTIEITTPTPAAVPDRETQPGPARVLSPEAVRALAEAADRRRLAAESEANRPKELGGRDGPDPVRFGDWEKGGIAWDF